TYSLIVCQVELASMEPSRERDGDAGDAEENPMMKAMLQWSRRANATETARLVESCCTESAASMEPARERDGDLCALRTPAAGGRCFNGAVARTRRRHWMVCCFCFHSLSFNGAVARTRRRLK